MIYKIVELSTNDRELFQREVNTHIRNGWELQGGVTVIAIPNSRMQTFFQAMVNRHPGMSTTE